MTTVKTRLKELRKELRYYQMCARADANCLRLSRAKCKEVGRMMRELQAAAKSGKMKLR